MTLKSRLRVTQGHWKRNHWIDHTRPTISRGVWRWILLWPWNVGSGHSRSLKVISFESLGTVSYSPSIVTMAVSLDISEIFSVKEWPDLEILVWQTMYNVLLVRHCNYSSILYHFRVIWRWVISWPWNLAQRSLKVIETGAIQKLGCGSLFRLLW